MIQWLVVNLEPTEDFTYRKSVQMNWFFLCLGRPWICIGHLTFRTEAVRQTKYNCFSFICMPLNTVRGEGCVSEKNVQIYIKQCYTLILCLMVSILLQVFASHEFPTTLSEQLGWWLQLLWVILSVWVLKVCGMDWMIPVLLMIHVGVNMPHDGTSVVLSLGNYRQGIVCR